jgi:hypothetical protein
VKLVGIENGQLKAVSVGSIPGRKCYPTPDWLNYDTTQLPTVGTATQTGYLRWYVYVNHTDTAKVVAPLVRVDDMIISSNSFLTNATGEMWQWTGYFPIVAGQRWQISPLSGATGDSFYVYRVYFVPIKWTCEEGEDGDGTDVTIVNNNYYLPAWVSPDWLKREAITFTKTSNAGNWTYNHTVAKDGWITVSHQLVPTSSADAGWTGPGYLAGQFTAQVGSVAADGLLYMYTIKRQHFSHIIPDGYINDVGVKEVFNFMVKVAAGDRVRFIDLWDTPAPTFTANNIFYFFPPKYGEAQQLPPSGGGEGTLGDVDEALIYGAYFYG